MPRDGAGVYTQPFPNVSPNTTVESAVYNGFVADVVQDMNTARPVVAGGTGATSGPAALANLGGESAAYAVTNFDTHVWYPGSFRALSSATAPPVAGHAFAGVVYLNEALAFPPTNQNLTIEARDMDDASLPLYVRQKKAGVWGSWLSDQSVWETGDAKLTYRTVAAARWIMVNDGSIGNAASGGTTRANADTVDLFTLFWNNMPTLVVQDSAGTPIARGANAAADFAANRRMVIPKALGRSLAVAGSGSGLSARALGSTAGSETETQTLGKLVSHGHLIPSTSSATGSGSTNWVRSDVAANVPGNTNNAGGGAPLDILDPTTYMNVVIRL